MLTGSNSNLCCCRYSAAIATIIRMCGEVKVEWAGRAGGRGRERGIVGIGAGIVGTSDPVQLNHWLGLVWDHILYARDPFYCDFCLPMAISMTDLCLNKT